MQRLSQVADVAVVLLCCLAVAVTAQRLIAKDPQPPTPDVVRIANFDATADSGHSRGSTNPRVRILEFGDYQCAACRAAEHAIAGVLARYPEEVAVSYRHFPISYHEYAVGAARGADCAADQGLFEEFHRELFASEDWRRNDRDFALRLSAVAQRVGVPDSIEFSSCLGDLSESRRIVADRAAGHRLGVAGTPTIFINGFKLDEMLDSARFNERVAAMINAKAAAR